MNPNFSVVNDPWVPVVLPSGRRDIVSVRDIFSKPPDTYLIMDGGHYGVQGEASVLRFLVHLTMEAMKGKLLSVSDVREAVEDTSAMQVEVIRYIDNNPGFFFLGGDRPFMQVPAVRFGLEDDAWTSGGGVGFFRRRYPLGKIMRDGKNNGVMSHKRDLESAVVPPHMLALGLVVQAAWSLNNPIGNGLKTKTKTIEGVEGCLTYPHPLSVYPGYKSYCGALLNHVTDPRGLVYTVARNILSDEEIQGIGLVGGLGAAPWEVPLNTAQEFIDACSWFDNSFHGRSFSFTKALLIDFDSKSLLISAGHRFDGTGEKSVDSAYLGFKKVKYKKTDKGSYIEVSGDSQTSYSAWTPFSSGSGQHMWKDFFTMVSTTCGVACSQYTAPAVLAPARFPDDHHFSVKTYSLEVKCSSGSYSLENAAVGVSEFPGPEIFEPGGEHGRELLLGGLKLCERRWVELRETVDKVVATAFGDDSIKRQGVAKLVEGLAEGLAMSFWGKLDLSSDVLLHAACVSEDLTEWEATVEDARRAAVRSIPVLESLSMQRAMVIHGLSYI